MIQIKIPSRVHAGTAIKMIREAKNISLKKMAAAFGVSDSVIWGLESGKTVPSQERLKQICDFLDIDLYVIILFAYTESPKAKREVEEIVNEFRRQAIKSPKPRREYKKRLLKH